MGERELREKYGGKLPKAVNRAIRAEIPGGNEALDTLTQLASAAKNSHWHDKKGLPTPEAEAYYKHLRNVVDKMGAQVRRTWKVLVKEVEDKPRRPIQSNRPDRPDRKSAPKRSARPKGKVKR
jgi:hypothetical protein